ncbi:sigma-54-dependent Fis family transcriptional regulator [Paenibacillus sp. 7124]|uniref:Sigma-54-dependent Fis family transcriptional regulator n=1 Tax=Paenibacillus apii TaxID=1850370 RepID=A0A6M1PSM2_9BACL|nr:sigma-54-dependent Fis family transcriptional regulator [Paenibacillus apii]NGM84743.1 sigma-54-dependent Fis family transcriptional regulator [Paenibacillus apii]NJJ41361.1 sigma-54-dependent Fis family transcriptional regulator [Paenibacillus apii]
MIGFPNTTSRWEAFIESGRIPEGTRPEIAASWNRCREAGVNPLQGRGVQVSAEELGQRLETKRLLVSVAQPMMNSIYQVIKDTVYAIVLTDQDGVLLRTILNKEIEPECAKVNFIEGARWDEASVGTNAVGTALTGGLPIQVVGDEHFCESHHAWTCSAAPIHDSSGRVIGCLDLSGKAEDVHPHTFGIVVSAVKSIEEQLNVLETNQLMNAVFQSMQDGLLVIDTEYRIRSFNERLASIFMLEMDEIREMDIKELLREVDLDGVFRNRTRIGYADCTLTVKGKKIDCMVNICPYTLDERVIGASLTIREAVQVRKEVNQLAGFKANYRFEDIVTQHPYMQEQIDFARKIARTNCTVLIEGESGTGKELFAQSIHNASARADGPFIAINCAALPKELVESELFGYEKGSFTGALREGNPGKFELASGGTIFLDEIGELSLEVQAKLLRVLDNHKVRRIGGKHERLLDVRVIAATNRDLLEEVAQKAYRGDLYYRLNVINLKLPPLRERPEDIPPLARLFLRKCNQENPGPAKRFGAGFLEKLKERRWSGNARELQNAVQRAYYLCAGDCITEREAPPVSRSDSGLRDSTWAPLQASAPEALPAVKSMRQAELESIRRALAASGGNVVEAARLLRIGKSTLYRKLTEYGIGRKDI